MPGNDTCQVQPIGFVWFTGFYHSMRKLNPFLLLWRGNGNCRLKYAFVFISEWRLRSILCFLSLQLPFYSTFSLSSRMLRLHSFNWIYIYFIRVHIINQMLSRWKMSTIFNRATSRIWPENWKVPLFPIEIFSWGSAFSCIFNQNGQSVSLERCFLFETAQVKP